VQNRKEQGAYYLAGYAVECALKACIAKLTKRNEFPLNPEYVRKTYTHDLSELLRLAGLEKQLEIDMSLNTALAITWTIVKGWNEEKRYVPTGLKGKNMYAALMGPDGVLTWIKQRW
jgi:HEPN domain-containing protein